MSYSEFLSEINRLSGNLTNEQKYYKVLMVYDLVMLSIMGECADETAKIVSDYFLDLLEDSETESEVVSLIQKRSEEIVRDFTEIYFEGNEDFTLFSRMLMRINNSTKKRAMDAYQMILLFHNLITHKITKETKYKSVARKKHISSREYSGYLKVLKNKDLD